MAAQGIHDFQGTLSGDRGTSSDPVMNRLEAIFSALQETSYRGKEGVANYFPWQPVIGQFATGSMSARPALRVLLPEGWRENLARTPEIRLALQEALGKIASGHPSVKDLLQGWGEILTVSGLVRVVAGGGVIEVDTLQESSAPPVRSSRATVGAEGTTREEPSLHSRLASELREMTGLGAGKLALAFGVSREQYSRWVSGAAISDVRHGQLRYLHTVVADVVRRLGSISEARVWFQTPLDGAETPSDLLIGRRWSELYRVVTAVSDEAPLVDGVRVALLAPLEQEEENPEELEGAEGEDSWSPYASGSN